MTTSGKKIISNSNCFSQISYFTQLIDAGIYEPQGIEVLSRWTSCNMQHLVVFSGPLKKDQEGNCMIFASWMIICINSVVAAQGLLRLYR